MVDYAPHSVRSPGTPPRPRHRKPPETSQPDSAPARHSALGARYWFEGSWLALGLLAFAAALLVRLPRMSTVYDIFIDEATYAEIARSVAQDHSVSLYGEPFILHPPLGFLIMGAGAWVHGPAPRAELVLALRPVSVVFGAAVIGLLFGACWAAGMRRVAVIAGALLIMDPFQLFFDGRLMLEPIAQAFAAACILSCVMASRASRVREHGGGAAILRSSWRWTIAAGAAGAATFATKETFGLVVTAMLALLWLFPAAMPRRHAGVALATTLLGYLGVNVAVIARVGAAAWADARFDGLQRLLGAKQTTGFKAEGTTVSLTERVVALVDQYGVTYMLLGLGGLIAAGAAVGTMLRIWRQGRRDPPDPRIVFVAWAVAACAYLAYAIGFGSLEEQMFYIPLAPCVVMVAVALAKLSMANGWRGAVAGVVLVALVGLQANIYVAVRSQRDDRYVQLLAWLPGHVPANSTISVTEDTSQFLIEGYDLGQWTDVPALRANDVHYMLLSESLASQGYGVARLEFAQLIRARGHLVYRSVSRTGNDLALYDVRTLSGAGP